MARLDQRRSELRDMMLRISGAIQVLEELTGRNGATALDPQEGLARTNEHD